MFFTEIVDIGGAGNSIIRYVTQKGQNENVTFCYIGGGGKNDRN